MKKHQADCQVATVSTLAPGHNIAVLFLYSWLIFQVYQIYMLYYLVSKMKEN